MSFISFSPIYLQSRKALTRLAPSQTGSVFIPPFQGFRAAFSFRCVKGFLRDSQFPAEDFSTGVLLMQDIHLFLWLQKTRSHWRASLLMVCLFFLTKPRALVQPVVTKVSTGYGNGEEQRETQVQVPDKRGRKKGAKSKRTKYALEAASDKQLQKGDQCQDSLSHPQSQTSPSCCVSAWTKQIGLCFSLSQNQLDLS